MVILQMEVQNNIELLSYLQNDCNLKYLANLGGSEITCTQRDVLILLAWLTLFYPYPFQRSHLQQLHPIFLESIATHQPGERALFICICCLKGRLVYKFNPHRFAGRI